MPVRYRVFLALAVAAAAGLFASQQCATDGSAPVERDPTGSRSSAADPRLQGRLPAPPEPVDIPVPEDPTASSAPPIDPSHIYTVRDLASGEPVPGLVLELRPKDGEPQESRTDIFGRLEVPRDPDLRLVVLAPGWRDTWLGNPMLREDETLWVYAQRTVRGIVRADPQASMALDLTTVVLSVFLVGPDPDRPGASGPAPWNGHWAEGHGLWNQNRGGPDAVDGSFEISVPRAPGIVVKASAPGWMPGWVDVPMSSEEVVELSDIVLLDTIRVSGAVTDGQGKPLASALVRAFVTQRRESGTPNFHADRAALHGLPFTAVGGADGGRVSYEIDVRTDAEGRYSFEYPTHGELLVVAECDGFATGRRELGVLRSNKDDVRFGLLSYEGPPLKFTRAGKPLAGWKCIISDLMGDSKGQNPQPASGGRLADDGSAPGTLMEPGRHYHVRLIPPSKDEYVQFQLVNWDGEREIDIRDHGF